MSFVVYKSSAGSGKTYTLVLEYLKLVIKKPKKFRNVLAITFTNKAANEMKERIIGRLKEVAQYNSIPDFVSTKELLQQLREDTGLEPEEISKNAALVLEYILHDYSDFAISTIDSFVHRVIRSFAFDLNLPLNFEVELNTSELITKAVDILISNVGTDEKLTATLINYIESKTSEDKSWNIENDLVNIAGALTKEDGLLHIEKLKKLNLDDFIEINKQVAVIVKKFENTIVSFASEADKLIKSKNIPHQAFYQGRSGISKYFDNLVNKGFDKIIPNSYVSKTVEEDKWYAGKTDAGDKAAIDEIKDDIKNSFYQIEKFVEDNFGRYTVFTEIRKNLYPLAVLTEIEKVMDDYKSDNNLVLISEFNKRIAEVVLNEPVPFIYERVGQKYKHFLIDEFQDTSVLQWQNLLPLIDNSLAEGNFNMIVGDGKQAIYRWRSGEVEQFIKLPKIYKRNDDPVQIERELSLKRNYKPEVLKFNYRSKTDIINFNNDFFSWISAVLPEELKAVYKDVKQKPKKDDIGGFIHIEFHSDENEAENFEDFNLLQIKETIAELQEDSFDLKDIAILCRNNKNASLIASDLLENGINVVSSESLLLGNSAKVRFLIAVVKVLLKPADLISKTEMITFLTHSGYIDGDVHNSLIRFGLFKNAEKKINFFEELSQHKIELKRSYLLNLQIYDLFEELIRIFGFNNEVDPYIQFFLDAILSDSGSKNLELSELPDWWEDKKEKLSIIVPEGINAVQVMTIHKSKGLQFPVVIYPFAAEKHRKTNDKLWIDFEDEEVPKLKAAIVNTNRSLEETKYASLYSDEEEKSLLDLINLLYVVMTRPAERLYIFAAQPPKKHTPVQSIPKLFKDYLIAKDLWQEEKNVFTFGVKTEKGFITKENLLKYELAGFISNPWRNRMLLSLRAPEYWDIEEPVGKQHWGNLIHLILSMIKIPEDAEHVIEKLFLDGIIDESEKIEIGEKIKKFLLNPEVGKYFKKGLTIKTEPEILLPSGKTYRPDRLIFDGESATVIDFKTGKPEPGHKEQVMNYKKIIRQMNYLNIVGVLLYLNEEKPVVIVD